MRKEKDFRHLWSGPTLANWSLYETIPLGTPGAARIPLNVSDYSSSYVNAVLRDVPPPVVLAGFCNFGKLALSVANQIAANGGDVLAVVMFDTRTLPAEQLASGLGMSLLEAASCGSPEQLLQTAVERQRLRLATAIRDQELNVSPQDVDLLVERFKAGAAAHLAAAELSTSGSAIPTYQILSSDATLQSSVVHAMHTRSVDVSHDLLLGSDATREVVADILASMSLLCSNA